MSWLPALAKNVGAFKTALEGAKGPGGGDFPGGGSAPPLDQGLLQGGLQSGGPTPVEQSPGAAVKTYRDYLTELLRGY